MRINIKYVHQRAKNDSKIVINKIERKNVFQRPYFRIGKHKNNGKNTHDTR